MTSKVSVIIPTYNCGPLLPGAVKSVRAQGYSDYEIIVVDDGSTDETSEVLRTLSGEDLFVIKQENAGPAAARNSGIAAAQGEWVAFLDADDLWLPGKLAAQLAIIQANPEVAFTFAGERRWYPNGRSEDVFYRGTGSPLLLELLAGNRFGTPTVIVQRRCLEAVGMFDPSLTTGEDWDLWLRLAARYESQSVEEPLAVVRKSPRHLNCSSLVAEYCTRRVLERLFSCVQTAQQWPMLSALRRSVYGWHLAVLAKSHCRQGHIADFVRLVAELAEFHPSGFRYLLRRHVCPPLFSVS